MSNGWPMVPLSEIAKPLLRPVAVVPGNSYRTIGVKWWGEGAYERETIDGAETAAKTLNLVKEGDLIINKIWVRHGSTAIATKAVDGCAASGEFPTFQLDRAKVLPQWLHWQTKTKDFWLKCDGLSRGTSGKNRIKPDLFLTITVPLPTLPEQRRIVARIEEVAATVQEALSLRRRTVAEIEALLKSSMDGALASPSHTTQPLEKVCDAIIDNLHSTPRYEGDAYPCIRSQDIGWGTINYDTALRTCEMEFAERTRRGEPTKGDIVFVREGDIGRCAVVDGSRRFSLGQRVMMFRPNQRLMLPRFLMYQLMSPSILTGSILADKTGTTSHHINIKRLRRLSIPMPALQEQHRIVAYLDDLQAKVDGLKQLQAKTAAELDALLPSILDKAFKGEL